MSDIKKDKNELPIKKTDSNLQRNFNDFLKNDHYTYIVLKTEKLASALYMVTGFVSENDPLRTRLRTCALDLVSTVSANIDRSRGMREHVASCCIEIGSMLNMAERAGLVSPMNAKVLCEEYAGLAAFVRDHEDKIFTSTSLDVTTKVTTNHIQSPSIRAVISAPNSRPISKKTNNYKRHKNRRETILSLLNKKDKITIKDVTAAVEGCSEKTIQRELIAMVDEGVLLKEGERRWSTYRRA